MLPTLDPIGSWPQESACSSEEPSEEGELSGGDEDEETQDHSRRLCPLDLSSKIIAKVYERLQLHNSGGSQPQEEPGPSRREFMPSGGSSSAFSAPIPQEFVRIRDQEWDSPNRHRRFPRGLSKLYAPAKQDEEAAQVPKVDQPVAALSSSTFYPSQGEGGPKDPNDRRTDSALKRGFEASSTCLTACSLSSLLARGILAWTQDLQNSGTHFPSSIRNTLRKIALTASLSADISLDAFQLSARALASNVVSRRNLWLRNWEVDQGTQAKLISVPFQGAQLFGQGLEPLLTEDKDKRKVLATPKGEQRRGQGYSFFRGHRGNYSQKGFFPRNQNQNRSRSFPRNRSQNYKRARPFQPSSSSSSGPKPKGPRPT